MAAKKNVTMKELLELTFNSPGINLKEAFSPETKAATKRYNKWKQEKDAEEGRVAKAKSDKK